MNNIKPLVLCVDDNPEWLLLASRWQGVTSLEEVLGNVRKDDFDSRPAWLATPPPVQRRSRSRLKPLPAQ